MKEIADVKITFSHLMEEITARGLSFVDLPEIQRFIERVPAADASDTALRWTKTPPATPGMYWNWNGSYDDAPFPLHVLYSGFSRRCFVSAGQGGIQAAINCDIFGGWWKPLIEEPVPQRSEIDAAIAAERGDNER